MRIIGGRLKGHMINVPAKYNARPTTDFAREALFNILDNEYEFEDLKVLDLFGGTGAVSFEFASRGASRVYCVEMARENASFIKTEAARLGLDNVTMVRDNVFDFLPVCRDELRSEHGGGISVCVNCAVLMPLHERGGDLRGYPGRSPPGRGSRR